MTTDLSGPEFVNGWRRERMVGSAEELHATTPPDDAGGVGVVRELVTSSRALVLGSAQSFDEVDLDAAAQHDIEVVRRRSGGGAVLIVPGESVWVDVWVPAGHRQWDDDVAVPAVWLGTEVMAALELDPDRWRVHGGGWQRGALGASVCFLGVGPGEVVDAVSGDKLVGIAQRRTRDWIRLQVMMHSRWRPAPYADLLWAVDPQPELERVAVLDTAGLVDALWRRLVSATN